MYIKNCAESERFCGFAPHSLPNVAVDTLHIHHTVNRLNITVNVYT